MAPWVREWPLRDDVWTDRDFDARDERLEAREDTGWYEGWAGPGVEGPTGDVTAGSSPAASPDPALAAVVSLFEDAA